jgi:3-hydroxyisobutyrate dehydrogenase-like beta-hydroxyacid dehydrogenase
MTDTTIGFVGIGLLGGAMAARLRAVGYRVIGFDVSPAARAAASARGIEVALSSMAVAQAADIIGICVTTTAAVEDVVGGSSGLCAGGDLAGKIVTDHSTTTIEATHRVAKALAARGARFLDVPVSGGPGAAESGTLALMAGGEEAAIERVRPLMERLGRFTLMGATGAGQATKLVNQTLVLTNYCVMAEALRLAESYGVDAAKVPHALATGHAGSNLLPVLFERMVARDWTPRGYARQVLKDLEMLNDAAHDKGLAMPMSAQALTLFRLLVAQGHSELDGAAIATLWPDRPGGTG